MKKSDKEPIIHFKDGNNLKKYNAERVIIDKKHKLVIKKWFKYFLERERINSVHQGLLLGFSGGLLISLIVTIFRDYVNIFHLVLIFVTFLAIFVYLYKKISKSYINV